MRSIFVLLEEFVQREYGPRDLAAVRAVASEKLGAVGRRPGPLGRVMAYFEAIAEVRKREVEDVYQHVSQQLVAQVLEEFGTELREHSSARTVLMHITRLAPPVLAALVPGAPPGDFDVELVDLKSMRIRFEGPEEMRSAFEGVAMGLAAHYGERAILRRVNPPAYAPNQRILEISIGPERRDTKTPAQPPGGKERRRLFGL